jgi:hypothetical protein
MATLSITAPKTASVGFDVKNPKAAINKSAPTKVLMIQFKEETRSLRIMCEDGNIREMRVDRAPSLEYAREVLDRLKKAYKNKTPVVFMAAGGFSADKWFFNIEA